MAATRCEDRRSVDSELYLKIRPLWTDTGTPALYNTVSACVHIAMRITQVPYTKKRVTTLDLVQTDQVLYRDEEWLAGTKDITGLNTRYLVQCVIYKTLEGCVRLSVCP